MELKFGQHVRSTDDRDVGTVKHLILDPANGHVKTLVVEKGFFLPDDIEIPVEAVQESGKEQLTVQYTAEQVKDLPRFDESRYMPITPEQTPWIAGIPYAGALWPIGYPLQPFGGRVPLPAPVVAGEMAVAPPPEVQDHLRQQDEQ